MNKKTKYYVVATIVIGITSTFYYLTSGYGNNNHNTVIKLSNNTINEDIVTTEQTVIEMNDYLARNHFSYILGAAEDKSQVDEFKEVVSVQRLVEEPLVLSTLVHTVQKPVENISRSQQIVQREETPIQPQNQVQNQTKTEDQTQLQPQTQTQTETQIQPQINQSSNQKYLSYSLNSYVLDIIKTYDTSKNYPYLLNTDYANYNGVTTNINFAGKTLLKAHPSGIRYSHCTGITFEVFFKAMEKRNSLAGLDTQDFNGMNYNDLYSFMLKWYVAGPKQSHNLAAAVESYGIGKRITNFEEAQPGDFIDISRENNTGHTAVFLGWIREEGKIIGLRYWSSQQSTKGINYNTEYFNVGGNNSSKYGNVMINNVYIARVFPINQYRSFR